MSATAQSSPFNAKLVVGLIVAGLAAFAALVLLIAFGDTVGASHGSVAPTESVSATGFKGLVTLVGRFRETRQIGGESDLATDDLVVVTLDRRARPEDVQRLLELRRDRATLLILPKWRTMPDPDHPGWVRALGPDAGPAAEELLGGKLNVRVLPDQTGAARGADFLEGFSAPVPAAPQVIDGTGLTPLLTVPGGALIARLNEQPHYVAADPDLFDNHGLADPARAQAAVALIDALNSRTGGAVAFDLTIYGLAPGGAPSLLRTALEPPFLPMTLALVFAALLAGLHGAFRFGRARREERAIAFGKAALVENSAGLIRLARREARLGGAYADIVRHDAARLAAAPAGLQGPALDAYLDRLSRGDGPPFSALAARLAAARDTRELVVAARALFSWKKDIIR